MNWIRKDFNYTQITEFDANLFQAIKWIKMHTNSSSMSQFWIILFYYLLPANSLHSYQFKQRNVCMEYGVHLKMFCIGCIEADSAISTTVQYEKNKCCFECAGEVIAWLVSNVCYGSVEWGVTLSLCLLNRNDGWLFNSKHGEMEMIKLTIFRRKLNYVIHVEDPLSRPSHFALCKKTASILPLLRMIKWMNALEW